MERVDGQAQQQWRKLCEIMAERLRTMTLQERHALFELQMARARGPAGNLRALRRMTSMILHARRWQEQRRESDD